MSSPVASASPATDRRLRGYGEIAAASLILGTSATLIQVSTMPASLLVVLRMALAGIVCGLLAGLCFATAMMIVKSLGPDVRGSTLAMFFCFGSVVLITPLAVWQTLSSHYKLTLTDTWIVIVSGLVYTALCFSLYTDGIRYVRVEHAGVLGYLEPVTSPLWALLLISEKPAWTTLVGGALIIAAGLLVIVFGRGEGEASVAATAEPEPF